MTTPPKPAPMTDARGMHPLVKDMTGLRFGKLVVLERHGSTRRGKATWKCICDCGGEYIAIGIELRSEHVASCGCAHRLGRDPSHGHARKGKITKEYRAFAHLHGRCSNPTDRNFHNYGGRGISVCERWQSFDLFLADMGRCPSGARVSIDRINNDGNYEPGNCRWTDMKTQQRNKSSNVRVMFRGLEMCLSEIAEITGIGRHRLYRANKKGTIDALLQAEEVQP